MGFDGWCSMLAQRPTTSTIKDKTAFTAVFSFVDDNALVGGVEGGSRERE